MKMPTDMFPGITAALIGGFRGGMPLELNLRRLESSGLVVVTLSEKGRADRDERNSVLYIERGDSKTALTDASKEFDPTEKVVSPYNGKPEELDIRATYDGWVAVSGNSFRGYSTGSETSGPNPYIEFVALNRGGSGPRAIHGEELFGMAHYHLGILMELETERLLGSGFTPSPDGRFDISTDPCQLTAKFSGVKAPSA